VIDPNVLGVAQVGDEVTEPLVVPEAEDVVLTRLQTVFPLVLNPTDGAEKDESKVERDADGVAVQVEERPESTGNVVDAIPHRLVFSREFPVWSSGRLRRL
jgi:hypothetical protein